MLTISSLRAAAAQGSSGKISEVEQGFVLRQKSVTPLTNCHAPLLSQLPCSVKNMRHSNSQVSVSFVCLSLRFCPHALAHALSILTLIAFADLSEVC